MCFSSSSSDLSIDAVINGHWSPLAIACYSHSTFQSFPVWFLSLQSMRQLVKNRLVYGLSAGGI